MDFPYEIRKVEPGRMVGVPDGENTVSYAVPYTTTIENGHLVAPQGEIGPRLPTWTRWGWLIDSVALCYIDDDKEKLFALAKESMESLPDLAHKFMLVYHRGERMFDNCYLVATNNQDWWQEYEVIG